MESHSALRSSARPTLVAILCLAQVVWCASLQWPLQATDIIERGLTLALGAAAALVSHRRWLRAVGMGLLLFEPTVVGIMTAVLGSVTPHDRTGIEFFGVFGFAVSASFVLGFWVNRWLERFAEERDSRPLSVRALFAILLVLCSLSIFGALGQLVLKLSYPDGLIPGHTPWGRAMVWVMMTSVPAALIGPGLLLFAAPVGVHLVRTSGLASGVGRAALVVGVLALISAAVTLNR